MLANPEGLSTPLATHFVRYDRRGAGEEAALSIRSIRYTDIWGSMSSITPLNLTGTQGQLPGAQRIGGSRQRRLLQQSAKLKNAAKLTIVRGKAHPGLRSSFGVLRHNVPGRHLDIVARM